MYLKKKSPKRFSFQKLGRNTLKILLICEIQVLLVRKKVCFQDSTEVKANFPRAIAGVFRDYDIKKSSIKIEISKRNEIKLHAQKKKGIAI